MSDFVKVVSTLSFLQLGDQKNNPEQAVLDVLIFKRGRDLGSIIRRPSSSSAHEVVRSSLFSHRPPRPPSWLRLYSLSFVCLVALGSFALPFASPLSPSSYSFLPFLACPTACTQDVPGDTGGTDVIVLSKEFVIHNGPAFDLPKESCQLALRETAQDLESVMEKV